MTTPESLANRDLDVAAVLSAAAPPSHARVVIVGGGIIGASIAYHLAAAGERDVVLLERGRLTNGTTWHAAGLVSQVRGTQALTALTVGNTAAYERIGVETGVDTGLRRNGSLSLARTPGRMDELGYGVSLARDHGVEVEVVGPRRILELWAGMAVDDLVGGTLFPGDATVNPGSAALAFAKGAVDRGVRYVPDTAVTGYLRGERGAVTGVVTSRGEIGAETVVLAAGLWTSELARLAGASVALLPAEHVWVMTDETELAVETQPFVRDLDGFFYVRHYRGRLVIGAFEPDGRPLAPGNVPTTGFVELGPDWDHFGPALAQARRRIPDLASIGFAHYLRAPESFTPDSNFQLGPLPEVPGLFVAAGLNSQGIIFGPGVGRAAAEWIIAGHPTMDLAEVDVARTGRLGVAAPLAPRAHGRVARQPVRHALARQAASHRSRPPPVAAARLPTARRARRSARPAAGSGRCGSSPAASTRRSATTIAPRRGSRRWARRSAPPATASRCTTSRRTPSSWSRAPGPWPASSAW